MCTENMELHLSNSIVLKKYYSGCFCVCMFLKKDDKPPFFYRLETDESFYPRLLTRCNYK